jgi:hypothetical protein
MRPREVGSLSESDERFRNTSSEGRPAEAMQATAENRASGRPRVFGVTARAIPLSDGGGSLLEHGIDVALLMTPPANEPFAIRAPRGTLGTGRHFVLRCPGLERRRGALARTTAVAELGMNFDLITAEMVHSAAPQDRPSDEATTGTRLRPRASQAEQRSAAAAPAPNDPQEASDRASLTRVQQRACATAVEIGGVSTIASEVSMTLRSALQMGEPVRLTAPRGEVSPGVYFSIRYFDASGAKRAFVRAETVVAQPGMVDEVEATLIRPTTQAEERQSYRAAFEVFFTAEVQGPNGARNVRGGTIDLSAGGIGFRVSSRLAPGDRLRITDSTLPDLDGAQLVVVRSDSRDAQRYGAAFVEPNRGAGPLATLLGLDRAEREHRRRREIEEIRRTRGATAAPLTEADVVTLRNQRMRTRKHHDAVDPLDGHARA